MKRIFLLVVLLLSGQAALAQTTAKRPITIDDLFKFKRVSDPHISPDGKWVVYALATVDDVASNKTSSTLWLASADGKTRRQLTTTDKKDRQPRWSPDGKSVLFVSTRSGSPQLWCIDLDGGEARQLDIAQHGRLGPRLVARRQAYRLRFRGLAGVLR